nr:transcription factor HES-3 [Pogona vitticeps]
MEKRRRARINLSLEQLKGLLEKHYSHQIRKRKLEKADILELSVKYMRTLHPPSQGLPATKSADFQAGFRSCLQGVRQFLLRSDAAPPARGRARPLKPQPRGPREGEDSIPLRASWSQAPSGQDRLPQSGHPLWRPW